MGDPEYEREKAKREAERRREQRKRRAVSLTKTIAIWAAVGAAVIGGGWLLVQSVGGDAVARPGEVVPNQGRAHVQLGEEHAPYNSIPPTSGPHTPQTARWGIYDEEIPDEVQVHNLEHGGVMIQYTPDMPPEEIQRLEDIGRDYDKVIVAPYSKNFDGRVALTAWQRIQILQAVDEEAIRLFVEANRNHAPERIP